MKRPFKRGRMFRLQIRIDSATKKKLDSYKKANKEGVRSPSTAIIVRRALEQYLSDEDKNWEEVIHKLDKGFERIDKLFRQFKILGELFLHYLHYYFYLWPELDLQVEEVATDFSYRMLAEFKQTLKLMLQEGGYLYELDLENLGGKIVQSAKELHRDNSPREAEGEGLPETPETEDQ